MSDCHGDGPEDALGAANAAAPGAVARVCDALLKSAVAASFDRELALCSCGGVGGVAASLGCVVAFDGSAEPGVAVGSL